MGWFSKKSDPITQRAKQLNDQIAALEAEIHRLATEQERPARAEKLELEKEKPEKQERQS